MTSFATPINLDRMSPYRASRTRGKVGMVLVGVATGALLLEALLVLQGFSLFDGTGTYSSVLRWQLDLNAASDLYILTMIAAGVSVLAWLSRAVDNVPALGGGIPVRSPRAAVGWWFVPLANFVVPYEIVSDLWKRMAAGPGARGVAVVAAWWVLWIGGALVERILGYAADSVDTISGFYALMAGMLACLACQVIAGVLLIRIIWQIEEDVRRRASALPSETASASPQPVRSAASAAATVGDASEPRASVVYCPRCGAARISGTRFCASCGTDLDAIAQAS